MGYTVRAPRPPLTARWDDPAWADRPALEIASFRPEGSDHRPRTQARLAYDDEGLGGIFHVEDRYVRSVQTRFGEPVYRDSCVEIFLQPKPDRGYLNFEMNAGGALLASHITDHRRTPDGFAAFTRLTEEDGRIARIRAYAFCPETMRAVGEEIGLRVRTGLYRFPTPEPGKLWPTTA